jgi:Mrp family chromosome partitioning ATPase
MSTAQHSSTDQIMSDFELLRNRFEAETVRPGLIVTTSATSMDGKELTARGLAYSFAVAGYRTLLIESALSDRIAIKSVHGLTLEELVEKTVPTDLNHGNFTVLNLELQTLQKSANQRILQTAIESLRNKFEFIVAIAETGLTTPFAATLTTAADFVVVSVRIGRRVGRKDADLANSLQSLGARFSGVVALEPEVINSEIISAFSPDSNLGSRRTKASSPFVI